jgi:hypothetical protein
MKYFLSLTALLKNQCDGENWNYSEMTPRAFLDFGESGGVQRFLDYLYNYRLRRRGPAFGNSAVTNVISATRMFDSIVLAAWRRVRYVHSTLVQHPENVGTTFERRSSLTSALNAQFNVFVLMGHREGYRV